MRGLRIVVAITDPQSVVLLRGQLMFLCERGHFVSLVCSPDRKAEEFARAEGVQYIPVTIPRPVAPIRDTLALFILCKSFSRLRPDVVLAGTPKAGLLSMLAGSVLGVPCKVYVLRGLPLETAKGVMRQILSITERIASSCADRIWCISPSLLKSSSDLGVIKRCKSLVVAKGSSNGIDVERFVSDPSVVARAAILKSDNRIPCSAQVAGFVGRFARDKGIEDLPRMWELVLEKIPDAILIMAGAQDERDPIELEVMSRLKLMRSVRILPQQDDVRVVLQAIDVLVLPTRREGFGNVAAEAAAMGKPVVAYNVTGVRDSVENGTTGVLVEPMNYKQLAAATQRVFRDKEFRAHVKETGPIWVRSRFSREYVHREMERVLLALHRFLVPPRPL